MAEIVNLNRVRKARDKAKAKTTAAANRVAHGRTKAERNSTRAERIRADRQLDQARRDE
jgi:hypothetical protein